jgi:hypothetical protein
VVFDNEELVRESPDALIQLEVSVGVEAVQFLLGCLDLPDSRVERAVVDLIVIEIFGRYSENVGLDAQVQILGHQDGGLVQLPPEVVGDGNDAVVIFAGIEPGWKIQYFLVVQLDSNISPAGDFDPVRQPPLFPQRIEYLGYGPGVSSYLVLSFLLVVYFLHYGERDYDPVFLESEDGAGIVQKHIRIDDVRFCHARVLHGVMNSRALGVPRSGPGNRKIESPDHTARSSVQSSSDLGAWYIIQVRSKAFSNERSSM